MQSCVIWWKPASWPSGMAIATQRNAALLLAFSLGRSSDLQVVEQLNLEHEEDLFLLMAQAHLPMPRLPDQATESMVGHLQKLL